MKGLYILCEQFHLKAAQFDLCSVQLTVILFQSMLNTVRAYQCEPLSHLSINQGITVSSELRTGNN